MILLNMIYRASEIKCLKVLYKISNFNLNDLKNRYRDYNNRKKLEKC